MADEVKETAESTAEQNATVETNEVSEGVSEGVDFEAEFQEAQRKAQEAVSREHGYAIRKSKEQEVSDESDLAERVAEKLFPKLQAVAESGAIEVKLDKRAGANESLKKLIRFHMDNTVNPNLPLDDKIEAAYAIANKKVVEKKVKEIDTARQNRAQILNTSQGSSTESHQKVGNNILSDNQLNELKRRAKVMNFNEKETERYIERTMRELSKAN